MSVRRSWIEREVRLAVSRQCMLSGVARSGVYAQCREDPADALELRLLELIDEQYTQRAFYGSRRMVVSLREQGYGVNRKRV